MAAERLLNGIDIFGNLPEQTLRELSKRCTWRRFAANELIIGYQDESKQVYLLTQGQARAAIFSLSGKEVIFRDICQGEFFGEFAAIDDLPRSANVEALESCQVAIMPPDVFWQVLREHPIAMAQMLQRFTKQIRALTERVLEFSSLAVRHRVHAELLRLAQLNLKEDGTAELFPAPTHSVLAGRVSTHREAVTRELNRLSQARLIERRKGRLIIHDVSRLARMVEDVRGH
jgi:CRP-like cAMP-binding protein